MLTSLSVNEFLNETASSSPAPGGGSVSALAAALGAALTSMVCRLTIGKKKYAGVQAVLEGVLKQSEILRRKFESLIDEDTAAFEKVMAAYGLPKESEEQKLNRAAAIQEATKTATIVPLNLMELCLEGIDLVRIIAEQGNQNSISDAGVAALMIQAAGEGAALNVKINLGSIQDSHFTNQTHARLEQVRTSLEALASQILNRIAKQLR
ncbi:MAG: methenyltetrahydrofolate cyclohydrolase [Ignavibacteriae bacterium]|nr:MAG: methenyltetrahydrofolate cyclohydrolase [Ignavibacteriota bacterium]